MAGDRTMFNRGWSFADGSSVLYLAEPVPFHAGMCAVQRRRFPMGASPIRQPLQPEAIGAVMEVTKWLKPSISVSQIGDSASVQAESAISGLMRCSKSVNRILFNHINRCREQRLRNSESEAFRGPP